MANAYKHPLTSNEEHRSLAVDKESNSLVASLRHAYRDDFNGTGIDPDYWDVVSDATHTVSVAGGDLQIATGTDINTETVITSKLPMTVPFRVWYTMRLSQRIVNQEFYLEVVNAAGTMVARWLFDGATATSGKYDAQNSSFSAGAGTATIATTASNQIIELQLFPDECWFAYRTADSVSGKAGNWVRTMNVPDPNETYYIRIRAKNLGTAPASSTTMYVSCVCAQDINELTAEITGGQGDAAAAKAIGVSIASSATTLSSVLTPSTTTGGFSSMSKLISAATTNAVSVKNAATNIGFMSIFNGSASPRYVKIYNKASAPTVGTDTPVQVYGIPAGQHITLSLPAAGLRLSTGFAMAITGGAADNDTTAIGAGEVVVSYAYV